MTPKRAKTMTARQTRFVESYLATLNATRAAVMAGYSRKAAAGQGSRLLKTPIVKKAIDAAVTERAKAAGIEQERILRELRIVAESSIDDFEIGEDNRVRVRPGVDPAAIKAVSSVRFLREYDFDGKLKSEGAKISLWDKPRGLTLAMRFLGILHDKLEVNVQDEMKRVMDATGDSFKERIRAIAARLRETDPPLKN